MGIEFRTFAVIFVFVLVCFIKKFTNEEFKTPNKYLIFIDISVPLKWDELNN